MKDEKSLHQWTQALPEPHHFTPVVVHVLVQNDNIKQGIRCPIFFSKLQKNPSIDYYLFHLLGIIQLFRVHSKMKMGEFTLQFSSATILMFFE